MLVGAGALGARRRGDRGRRACSAPASPRRCSARRSSPDDLPFVTGSIGLLGTEPSDKLMEQCDTLLMVGSSFPYAEFLPKEGQARGVQIDIVAAHAVAALSDGGQPARRRGADAARAAAAARSARTTARWRRRRRGLGRRLVEADGGARDGRRPIRSTRSASSGSCRRACPTTRSSPPTRARAPTGGRAISRSAPGMMASLSGNLATMGPAMPYAVAAKFAYPDRPVIAAVGDGAMQMIGNSVLITIAAHYTRVARPAADRDRAQQRRSQQVTWEQRVMVGDPEVRRLAGPADVSRTRNTRELLGLARHRGRHARADRAGVRAGARAPTARSSSSATPIRRSRRCRRTSRFKQARQLLVVAHHTAIPHRWRMVEQSAKQVWAGIWHRAK